jgi:hypothetical protein
MRIVKLKTLHGMENLGIFYSYGEIDMKMSNCFQLAKLRTGVAMYGYFRTRLVLSF